MRVCSMIAFAGGLVVGGVVALMLAPKKGEDFRRDIKEKLADVQKQFAEQVTVCKDGYCRREEMQE